MNAMACALSMTMVGYRSEINTEPIIRIYAEGRTRDEADSLADQIIEIVKKYKVLPFTADRGINTPVSMSLSNIKHESNRVR